MWPLSNLMQNMDATSAANRALPDDLIVVILLCLPVKSLLKFKSICKKWHAIIRGSRFIQLYGERHCSPRLLVYLHYIGDPTTPMHKHSTAFALYEDETLERYEEPDHLKLPGVISELRGPCKGIFCVVNMASKLALWNPATRRMRPLPIPPKVFSRVIDQIGFGIDAVTNEIKVVLFIGENSLYCSLHPYYAVYSSNSDSWRYYEEQMILGDTSSCIVCPGCRTTFLNGFYYWVKAKIREDEDTNSYSILAFDMHNEVFEEIEMPETLKEVPNLCGDLCLYNDDSQLAWFCYNDICRGDKQIDIWVMEKKGYWTKLLTCTLQYEFCGSLGFWTSKKFFVLAGIFPGLEFKIHDPDSPTITPSFRIEKRDVSLVKQLSPCCYNESLVSVDRNGTPDYDVWSDVIRKFLAYVWPGQQLM